MKVVIYLFVALALAAWNSHSVNARLHSAEWEAYKEQHGKVYEDLTEDVHRYANYLATKNLIQEHNSAQSSSSFRMELNHMADWSMDEFTGAAARDSSVNKARDSHSIQALRSDSPLSVVPNQIDWRKNQDFQVVGEVGDQGKCASGWAFAATGVIEGREGITNMSSFVQLSAQQLLDCSTSNGGCQGGFVSRALADIYDQGGIESDKTYPYNGKHQRQCAHSKERSVLQVVGMQEILFIDEDHLSRYLVRFGPVAIELDATEKLKSYKSGVFEDSTCSKSLDDINHSALIVGYGTDKQAGDFWIVKNSWSTKWGEQGYFRLKRGVGACGLLTRPTIPLFYQA